MSELTPWHSFRVRKTRDPSATVVGAYGGHPRGIRAHQWPRCAVCGAPMCHMAQIESGPWLDLNGHARMSLFICHATGGRCEDWDPWKGANKVLLHKHRDDNLFDGPPTVRVYRRTMLTIDAPLDERAVMAQVRTSGVRVEDALGELRHDKLGGGAVWRHGDDTPQSRSNQGPMRLALQFTTDVVKFDITTGGMGYVFIDPWDTSENAAKLLWQGG